MLTQPMYKLSSFLACFASPMMTSVLPPPMSHDQPAPGLVRHGVRHAEIDQARFLDAGDDFDRLAERGARAIEKCAFAPGSSARVRCQRRRTLSAFMSCNR
jgi:hypothetical protein